MTEDEAKTKWCHATAFRTLYDDAARRPENADASPGNRCIASACMAWRWNEDHLVRDSDGARVNTLLAGETGKRVSTGFCGLAGAPQ